MISLLFLLFFNQKSFALESSARGDLLLLSDQRWLHTPNPRDKTAVDDAIAVAGVDLSTSKNEFTFEARPEVRAHFSESLGSNTQSPYLSLKGPRRYLDLRSELSNTNRLQAFLDLERLAVSYHTPTLEALVGRKIFSAGVLKLFPVWNKFSRPMPFLPSPILIYGQDQATLSYQRQTLTARAAFLPEDNSRYNTSWIEGGWLPEKFEVHALASRWWDQSVCGLSAATDFAGATARAESLFISPFREDSHQSQTQIGLGVERLISEKWTAVYEGYYQSAGLNPSLAFQPFPFTPLQANYYSAAQLVYQYKETLNFTIAALVNHDDESSFANFKVDDSLDENSNVIAEIKGPLAKRGELSSSTLGLASQVSLAYKRFF